MVKVLAGTFYGYEMFIEVPEVQAEFIKNQWMKYSEKIRKDQEVAAEIKKYERVN